MRRVLVLGGTGWLGRAVVEAAVSEGAEVVCLARGESGGVPDGSRLVRADRRQPGAYGLVKGAWDEVIELSYEPDLVEPALDELAARAGHWTLVSTVSVYARNDEPYADESADLVEPEDLAEYADAKVAAERITAERVGDRLLIARPGLIVGPGDPSDRFGYWAARMSRPGRALAPIATDRFVPVIDVDDLATWIELAGRDGLKGVVNAVGEIHTMSAFFEAVREVAEFHDNLVAVSDAVLLEHGVRYWAGPRSLPLWLPAADSGFAQRSGAAFLKSGGALRPLREILTRTLEDEIERGADRPRRSGLTAAEEAAVLHSVQQ